MPVPKSQQGKPLGGIGAQAMTRKKHSLVIDDRLLSKQYITSKADAKVDNTAYGGSWADVTDVAPSKGAVQAYLNSLSVTTSAWTQSDADLGTAKTRTFDTGYVGIGAGSGLAYTDITERLTVDGNIKGTGNLITGTAGTPSSLSFLSDSSQIKFGVDSDTILTHTDGLGLTLNDTNKLCFNDGSQFIQGSSTTILSIAATDKIDLTATETEINGNADINGDADGWIILPVLRSDDPDASCTSSSNDVFSAAAWCQDTTNWCTGDDDRIVGFWGLSEDDNCDKIYYPEITTPPLPHSPPLPPPPSPPPPSPPPPSPPPPSPPPPSPPP